MHSADINEDILTYTASQVLSAGHGICFAKSHLLAAILRCKSVPAGFCYQKLILDDEIDGYTGTGAGLMNFRAEMHDESTVVSQPYEVLDCIYYDDMSSDRNTNYYFNLII